MRQDGVLGEAWSRACRGTTPRRRPDRRSSPSRGRSCAGRCRAGRSAAGGPGTATPSRPAACSARRRRRARGAGRPARGSGRRGRGRPVLVPALAGAGGLDARRPRVARSSGLQVRQPTWPRPGSARLGQLEAVVRPLPPAPQVDGLPGPAGLLEAQDVAIERERRVRRGREHLDVREVGDQATRHHSLLGDDPATARSGTTSMDRMRGAGVIVKRMHCFILVDAKLSDLDTVPIRMTSSTPFALGTFAASDGRAFAGPRASARVADLTHCAGGHPAHPRRRLGRGAAALQALADRFAPGDAPHALDDLRPLPPLERWGTCSARARTSAGTCST